MKFWAFQASFSFNLCEVQSLPGLEQNIKLLGWQNLSSLLRTFDSALGHNVHIADFDLFLLSGRWDIYNEMCVGANDLFRFKTQKFLWGLEKKKTHPNTEYLLSLKL